MARGRKPISEATAALRGDAGKRGRGRAVAPAHAGETAKNASPSPTGAGGAGDAFATSAGRGDWEPPAHLPAAIAEVWARELRRLRAGGHVRIADLSAFEVYCSARARWEICSATIAEHGMTYTSKSKHGDLARLRPEMTIIAACERTMRTFMDGLTMTTRSRMHADAALAGRQGSLFPTASNVSGAMPAAAGAPPAAPAAPGDAPAEAPWRPGGAMAPKAVH